MDAPEIYTNRGASAWCRLDPRHFEWRNKSVALLDDVGGYCLDAPDQLPAGSSRRYSCWSAQSLVSREDLCLTPGELANREALAEQIIAEILAEERADGPR